MNCSKEYFKEREKLFLTLYYNKKHVGMFDANETEVQNLTRFMYITKTLFLENQYVTCGCGGAFWSMECCITDSDLYLPL